MSVSIVIDLAALAWLLIRQVAKRPLSEGYRLPLVLGIVGLFEFGAYLAGGGQQFSTSLKDHRSLITIPDGKMVLAAVAGSLILAVVTGAIRAPTVRLWWQDGQYWRQGTWVTLTRARRIPRKEQTAYA
jgi:hypothetical protein